MEIQITQAQFLAAVITLLTFFVGLVIGLGKLLLGAYERRLMERFDAAELLRQQATAHWDIRFSDLKTSMDKLNSRIQEGEDRLKEQHQDMVENYVRREDWILMSSTFNHQLEKLSGRFDRYQELETRR